jgi:hypothetical protein
MISLDNTLYSVDNQITQCMSQPQLNTDNYQCILYKKTVSLMGCDESESTVVGCGAGVQVVGMDERLPI